VGRHDKQQTKQQCAGGEVRPTQLPPRLSCIPGIAELHMSGRMYRARRTNSGETSGVTRNRVLIAAQIWMYH
jgi:hypothetical protein